MIEFQNVSFSYGAQKVLEDVTFKVEEGHTMVVLGGSGSGKSTILRLILGLIEPDQGRIILDDEDITQVDEERMVELRKKMGMVFQEGALFDSLTVGENVGYFLLEHGMRGSKHKGTVEEAVRELLGVVGLEHTIDKMPSELSGGMRRRVAVARSLIYHPEIMLYDEPTTGLDPATCEALCDLINEVKRRHHVSAIMVTHNMDDAKAVGDCFLLLREGRVLWQGTAQALHKLPDDTLPKFFRNQDLPGMAAPSLVNNPS